MSASSSRRYGRTSGGTGNRLRLVAVVLVTVVLVAAIAYGAAASGLGPDDQAPIMGNDQPMPVEPDGGIGDTPLPVVPDGGIGDTPLPVTPAD